MRLLSRGRTPAFDVRRWAIGGDAVTDLGSIPLRTADGDPVTLAEVGDGWLVVQLVRYYGCLPCQVYIGALDAARDQFEGLGAAVVVVGGSADYQARWLADRGVTIPLLLDPDHELRAAVGLGRLRWHRLLLLRGARNYGRSFGKGFRPMKITRDTVRSPGVVILDARHRRVWAYEGHEIGDYPPLGDVLDALRSLARPGDPRLTDR